MGIVDLSPRCRLDVDMVVLDSRESPENVLLVLRAEEPFKGLWCVPGGAILEHEGFLAAAKRKLKQECGLALEDSAFAQIGAAPDLCNDPRGWSVSIVFRVIVDQWRALPLTPGEHEESVGWHSLHSLPPMVSDFDRLVKDVASGGSSWLLSR